MPIKTFATILLGLSLCAGAFAAPTGSEIRRDDGGTGTLVLPERAGPVPVMLLVADAGPASPDDAAMAGSLAGLAQALAVQGIASVRYRPHGSQAAGTPVDDAAGWIAVLKADPRFGKVVVVGHGEGMLVALLAANRVGAGGFVSLAGRSDEASAEQFGKLKMHARIIRGSLDTQAGIDDARRLEQGRPGTPVVVIEGMDHQLRITPAGGQPDADAPVAPELVTALAGFAGKR